MAFKGLMARSAEDGAHANAEGQTTAMPVKAQASGPRTVAPSTSVDASSELEGRLRCKETLRIDGRITGQIECEKAVLVGQGAQVKASVDADEVQVAGRVEGDIAARRKITLERTAVVIGNLTTPGIVVEEGAKLKGRIVIGSDAEEELAAKAPQQAKDAKEGKKPGKSGAERKPTASKDSTGPVPVAAASA